MHNLQSRRTQSIRRRPGRMRLIAAVIGITAAVGLWHAAHAEEPAAYTGGEACAACHAAQTARWRGSHHALAMQKATPTTVLGDFANASIEHHGVRTEFSRDGGRFMVRTQGPDGAAHDHEIAYTFGVDPLQQYLIAMPGGRLQALGVAWDSRPKAAGGQRWFALNPDLVLTPGDPLHWTGRDMTWNHMCADCHSTNVRKNYDATNDSYATAWTDVGVSCEACHGPGSRHIAWARASEPAGVAGSPGKGLTVALSDTNAGQWEMNPATGIARRTAPRSYSAAELDTCGGCHALRGTIAPNAGAGTPLVDTYMPALLQPGQYHPDGQIDGEVFEYGSFLQSRMYRAGVICTDCHEPHALGVRAEGNAVCAQCHLPAKFDTAEHHHHMPGGAGAQCANCHMPQKTYMQVHLRHDHGFRVPRPDLSEALGTPDTCTTCHAGKTAAWAAGAVASWYPDGRQTRPHFGAALHAGRVGAANAEARLNGLILDPAQPAIARATALTLLPRIGATGASLPAWRAALADPDPLVRLGAVRGLPAAPSAAMVRDAIPLLEDPRRAVRVDAARALAGADPQLFTPTQRTSLDAALRELIASETLAADRPEAHLNLGLLDIRRGLPDEAETEYRTALRLDPKFVPALVNLADLARARGQDGQSEALLRQAMAIEPNNADIHHSLGLALVRQHNQGDAMPLLRQANELAPDNARYAYVYAIALNSAGDSARALAVLDQTHRQHPADRNVLAALISIARESGDLTATLRYARELARLTPGDVQLQLMIRQLEQRVPR